MILNCIPSLHSDFLVGLSQTFPILTFLGPSAEFDPLAPLCCWNLLSSWLLWFPIFLVVFVLVWQLLSRLPCRCLFFRLPLLVGILQGSILGPLFSPLLFSSHSVISLSMLILTRKIETKPESYDRLLRWVMHTHNCGTFVSHSCRIFPKVSCSSALSPLHSGARSPLNSKETLLKYKSDRKSPLLQTCKSCPSTTRSCPNSSWLRLPLAPA